jgi:cytochrome c oxidase cbb3-type subunit III
MRELRAFRPAILAGSVFIFCLLLGCAREQRNFREATPSNETGEGVQMSDIAPGHSADRKPNANPYEDSAYAVSQGKQLYEMYNCVGCHFHGGGGIGPPLMDNKWIYGSEPQNVYETIVEGRPNGMPSFRGKIPEQQLWEIVAYVRSMSGQLPKDVSPGREDHMYSKRPEASTPKEHPPQTNVPEGQRQK